METPHRAIDKPGHGVDCPGCGSAMTTLEVELYYTAAPVEIDACPACNLLWFDHQESLRMTPQSVLNVFRFLGKHEVKPHAPLQRDTGCVRCRATLRKVFDMQRNTRFTYWRCPDRHGDLITFNQFLLQKNFIRTATAADLARLKKLVRQVACAQCGGPIDLAKDSTCTFCSAAVAIIDPDGIAKAVKELGEKSAASAPASDAQVRALLIQIEHETQLEEKRAARQDDVSDLLSAGMGALAALLTH